MTDDLVEILTRHSLQGDTAQINDAAGLCSCGAKFYVYGGSPERRAYALVELRDRHIEHVAEELSARDARVRAEALEQAESAVQNAYCEGVYDTWGVALDADTARYRSAWLSARSRARRVRAEERERIATAIQAERAAHADSGFPPAWFAGMDRAARVARGVS